ncbi:Putative Holliday junction resolvase [Piscirickettsia salmonis]|uniref:Putative pre-16S rRNA nuclease n=1 Tax=Piscirickettsia salmonis TaxID=1238 RepID=A0A1L6TFV9_PISSA|nr:Holliday junction resolvase RuvX [Piscirickettsia salmonis]AKP74795.2 Holliday junction resolvase [Piscirickettsia salmonis LF-89 = ATCC VR-1361]ALB21273.1 Ribonuclease H YqgF [Piscirickettsia salmonis]ALY01522.1 crossover junction endodeoxyribonuclease RuvA [Piscirickettsia salmonis]AMA41035.1 crossover junction endodeoxyribonuclease RuvA [Piscirickettsia salmonis]AOS36224.1 crossover junction endodeoxyribonuclease RuvA [Piscirickettsia salmonis]
MAREQIVLGFDFGMKRLGVAVGQTLLQSANPLAALKTRDGIPAWDEIAKLITEWQPNYLIVGRPLHMNGQMIDPISYAARKFANRLHERFKLPVIQVDERLSSIEAKSRLQRQDQLDSMAAVVIIETWLHEQDQGQSDGE